MRKLRRYSLRNADTDAKRERMLAELLSNEFLPRFVECVLDDAQRTAPTASLITSLSSGGDWYLVFEKEEPAGAVYIYGRHPRDGGLMIAGDVHTEELKSVARDVFNRYGFRKLRADVAGRFDCAAQGHGAGPFCGACIDAIDLRPQELEAAGFVKVGSSLRDVLLNGQWVASIHLELINPQYDQPSGEAIPTEANNGNTGKHGIRHARSSKFHIWKHLRAGIANAARSLRGY